MERPDGECERQRAREREVVRVTTERLSIDEAHRLVGDARAGAIACFTGTTRDNFEGKRVIRLEYEAYEEMALKEMRKVIARARQKHGEVLHIALLHRVGHVQVGEASVIVAVSSAHRKPALACCAYLIDELKATVPIWKKEQYDDGDASWKANGESAV